MLDETSDKKTTKPPTPEPEKEPAQPAMVSVLYSAHRDCYTLASERYGRWLSVEVQANKPKAGEAVLTAAGNGYRRVYAAANVLYNSSGRVALPANDPLVIDYLHQQAASKKS